jgi:ubiquinone/menaquinone biosynthesis C-methylase UbiE
MEFPGRHSRSRLENKLMNLEEIRAHWADWSRSWGTDLRATTRGATAKQLEIDALSRRFARTLGTDPKGSVLEVGCGNGINCVSLAARFSGLRLHGIDIVEGMIESAGKNAVDRKVSDRVTFSVGDALEPAKAAGVSGNYDLVFTDRCIINLNTTALQVQAIGAMARLVRPGGHLVMIENSAETHARQNDLRQMLGLERRKVAEFNLFFDDAAIRAALPGLGLELVDVEDFGSLHDLVLYVLLPTTNGGEIDYTNPLVAKAAELNAKMSAAFPGSLGAFGQNRMYVCRRGANGGARS